MTHLTGVEKQNYFLRLSNEEANRITRESLRLAFICLLETKELDDISISELVRKAGTSRTAFYRNYGTKEELIQEIRQNIMTRLKDYKLGFNQDGDIEERFLEFYQSSLTNRKIAEALYKANLSSKVEVIYSVWKQDNPAETAKEYYYQQAIDVVVWNTFWNWIGRGFQETPEEMAKISAQIYKALNCLNE